MAAESVTASMLIDADPDDVYVHFTQPEAMLRWMGQWAHLDARPGGTFAVDIDGAAVRGRYLELDPPRRLLFTWGFAGSDELRPGASTVEVLLSREGDKTRVKVVHSGLPEPRAPEHAHGWRRFLRELARPSAMINPPVSFDSRP